MRRSYLNLLKYYFIKNPKTPIQLIHFVTSKCNAKCKHCFFWSKLNSKDELSLEEIDKFSKSLPDLIILNISGGEPFIRQDFAEIIKTYYRNTPVKEVAVPTNGTFTSKIVKDCIDILENCPDLNLNVVISLDGPENIHDEIRQVNDCFNMAIKTFNELKLLQKKYSHLQLSVISTLTSINQDKLEEFHSYVKNVMKPDVFGLNLIRGEARVMNLFGVDLNKYKLFFQLQSKSSKKGIKSIIRDYMNKLRTGMIIKTIENKKFIIPCKAGSLMAVIYEQGEVYPCELLNNKSLGNIKDFNYNFKKLWASQKTKETCKFIRETKCYCTHECFQRFNIIYNPKFITKHASKAIFRKSKIINALKINYEEKNNQQEMVEIGQLRGVRHDYKENYKEK
ncbi:radical SAM protein [Candidatus Woesearchaeota archaeon]|jgi:MoaA/NifB/PqqE/SkfB family radical SAM enzyme|nr:radical SAM protein [Candidatus Woesearchaeota archaeon]